MGRITERIYATRARLAPAVPSIGVLRVLRVSGKAEGLLGGALVAPVPDGVATLGRGLHNSVVLVDPSVSREHARLFLGVSGWQVENQSSANMVWVDGGEVPPGERADVAPGSVIRLGHTELQLLAPVAPDPPETLSAATGELGYPSGDETPSFPSGASGTQLLGPGITLQFALRGRFSAGTRWGLILGAALLFLVSATVTLGTAILVGRGALASEGIEAVLTAITIPLIPALGVVCLVTALDRYEREPWFLLVAAFLWGAIIAIPPALFIERGLAGALVSAISAAGVPDGFAQAAAQAMSAGVTEEAVKGAGLLVLLYFLRDEFDNVTDGLLYGALIGAGFAMVENFVYFAVAPRSDLGFIIFGRVVLGWLSHSTFTGLFGAGLGYARETRDRLRQVLLPLAGFLVGLLLHTGFNLVAFGADVVATPELLARAGAFFPLVTVTLEYTPLFAAQVVLLRVALASLDREAATVRAYLADEVLAGAVSPEEYVLVQDASLRAAAEHAYLLGYGPRVYLTARALYQTATGLAFRKWHVALGDPPKRLPRQPEDAYRARIGRLRRSLQRQIERHLLLAPRAAEPTRPLHRGESPRP